MILFEWGRSSEQLLYFLFFDAGWHALAHPFPDSTHSFICLFAQCQTNSIQIAFPVLELLEILELLELLELKKQLLLLLALCPTRFSRSLAQVSRFCEAGHAVPSEEGFGVGLPLRRYVAFK